MAGISCCRSGWEQPLVKLTSISEQILNGLQKLYCFLIIDLFQKSLVPSECTFKMRISPNTCLGLTCDKSVAKGHQQTTQIDKRPIWQTVSTEGQNQNTLKEYSEMGQYRTINNKICFDCKIIYFNIPL